MVIRARCCLERFRASAPSIDHGEKGFTTERKGRTVSLHVSERAYAASVHGSLACISCHADVEGKECRHEAPLKKVDCALCHETETRRPRGLAPRPGHRARRPARATCTDCHGKHDILAVKDPASPVAPLKVPFICGKCHRREARSAPADVHQDHILENYSESIHGEGLLKKGLIVAPTCASCHTAHSILPHTDPRSSIARANIAATCTQCHAQIEEVHRKVIKGELWEKEAHVLPACVDCHQPHKVRKVFYDQGMADRDCLRCHARTDIKASQGRPLAARRRSRARAARATPRWPAASATPG